MKILSSRYRKNDVGMVLVYIRLGLTHDELFQEWGVTKMIGSCDFFSIKIIRSLETHSVLLSVPSNVISYSTRLLTSFIS